MKRNSKFLKDVFLHYHADTLASIFAMLLCKKKYILVFLLTTIFYYGNLSSQTFEAGYFELSSPLSGNYQYNAFDSIVLLPDFSFNSKVGENFYGSITEYSIENLSYITKPSEYIALNEQLEVGSLPGEINISPGGAVQYHIPVIVPPGTRGLAPTISIDYSSQRGKGLIGRGWNLNGFSRIQRVSKDIYHDGIIDGIHFDSTDRYTLNGNRLISINGSYGANGTEYRKEFDDFSQIKSYGSAGNGPSYFTIKTKSGLTIEYGNTEDSRIEAQGKDEAMYWYISKISDKYGNYIEYRYYENNETGEFYPLCIYYTGNSEAGLLPYNTVKFIYEVKQNTDEGYIKGSLTTDKVLLKRIDVLNNEDTVRNYEFDFYYDFESKLSKITLFGENRNKLNSTRVNWGDYQITCSKSSINSYSSKQYTGDFNGDGFSDYITVRYDSIVESYINTGNGIDYSLRDEIYFNSDFQRLYIQDLNGDMYDDIIVEVTDTISTFTPYLSNDSSFIEHQDSFTGNPSSSLCLADFDGDGLIEGILRSNSDYDVLNFQIYPSFDYSIVSKYLSLIGGDQLITSRQNNNYVDFDGDGKVELLALSLSGLSVFDLTNNELERIYYTTEISKYHDYFVGDYNGDGLTDILDCLELEIDNEIVIEWNLHISTGTGLLQNSLSFDNISPDNNKIFSEDVNGDGKTDVIICGKGSLGNTQNKVYLALSKGEEFEISDLNENYSGLTQISQIADFDGDGFAEILDSYKYDFFQNYEHLLVGSIYNGLNRKVELDYGVTTDTAVYEKYSNALYPLIDIQKPINVVTSLISDNSYDSTSVTTFKYAGAKFHIENRNYLGFLKIVSQNQTNETQIINSFEIDSTLFIQRHKKQEIKLLNGENIYKETYNNSFTDYGNNRVFLYTKEIDKNYYLSNVEVNSGFEYDNYGNQILSIKNHSTLESDSIIRTFVTTDSWCPSDVETITHIKNRSGEERFVTSTDYDYDIQGNLYKQSLFSNTAKPLETTFTYDTSFGMIIQETQSATGLSSRSIFYEYDDKGRYVTEKTNQLGQTIEMTYDGKYGNIISKKDPNGLLTSFTYDSFGNLIETLLPNGKKITNEISWAEPNAPDYALYYESEAAEGATPLKKYYDKTGRTLREILIGFDGSSIYKDIIYNADGTIQKISEPYFSYASPEWTEFSYDEYSRKTGIDSPTADFQISYNGLTTTTSNISASPTQTTSKTYDVSGNLTSISDAAGNVNYNYYSNGKPKNITAPGGLTISFEYDARGNQTKITDPNSGICEYTYNAFNELISQDYNNNVTSITYDTIGRIKTLTETEGTITYNYDTGENGIGKLISITGPDSVSISYSYDSLSRVSSIIEDIGSESFTESYNYDPYGRLQQLSFPSQIQIEYVYNNYHYLSQIKRKSDNLSIWQCNTMNERGQIKQFTYGNNLVSNHSFENGFLTGIQTNNVQDMRFQWDFATGNLTSRSDSLNTRNLYESFSYDNLNRLTGISSSAGNHSFNYHSNGNIDNSTIAGTYQYGSIPHAVTQVINLTELMDTTNQQVAYTSYNKVKEITQGSGELQILYGVNRSRKKTIYTDSTIQQTRYYTHGNYEKETGEVNRELHYIFAGAGPVAVIQRVNSTDSVFYIHADHLGSFNVITDEGGNVYQEASFNAFGIRRDPSDWSLTPDAGGLKFRRGFTGHEHMEDFGTINMNGSMYDPVIGRFFSPDIMVPDPMNSQSYNRYSYCLNNPLKYVDPSGFEYNHRYPWESNSGGSGAHSAYDHSDGKGGTYSGLSGMVDAYADAKMWGYSGSYGTFSDMYLDAFQSYGEVYMSIDIHTQQLGTTYDEGELISYSDKNLSMPDVECKATTYTSINFSSSNASSVGGDNQLNPAIPASIAVGGGGVGGLKDSYKYGNHTVKYAQRINGQVRNAKVLSRASQMNAAKMASGLKVVGRGVTGLSIATAGYQFATSDMSGNDYARMTGSLIITGTAFIPIVGPVISIGLGVADSYGAFDNVYNYFE